MSLNVRVMSSAWWNFRQWLPFQWHHNEYDGVANHQPHDCLLNRYSGADQRKHQSSASLAFVRRIHWGPVNSAHKGQVTRKCFHSMTSLCIEFVVFRTFGQCWQYHDIAVAVLWILHEKNLLLEAGWRIYASVNWVTTGSDNSLSPVRRRAII